MESAAHKTSPTIHVARFAHCTWLGCCPNNWRHLCCFLSDLCDSNHSIGTDTLLVGNGDAARFMRYTLDQSLWDAVSSCISLRHG